MAAILKCQVCQYQIFPKTKSLGDCCAVDTVNLLHVAYLSTGLLGAPTGGPRNVNATKAGPRQDCASIYVANIVD